jgi:uncharacterized protein (TIGR00369 family)
MLRAGCRSPALVIAWGLLAGLIAMTDSSPTASNSSKNQRSGDQHCFVCGPDNPDGMQIKFRLDEGLCKAEYTPTASQCGYDGVTHGGILFSLLDDVMANWLFLQGERAFTGSCEIRFRKPAATGAKINLEGEQVARRGRKVMMIGRAINPDDGSVLAETKATFIVVSDQS